MQALIVSCVHYLARFGILILRWPCVVDRTSKSSLYFGLFRHAIKYPLENPCLAIVRIGTHGKAHCLLICTITLVFWHPVLKQSGIWDRVSTMKGAISGTGSALWTGQQRDRVGTVNGSSTGQGQHCEQASSGTGSALWMGHQGDSISTVNGL